MRRGAGGAALLVLKSGFWNLPSNPIMTRERVVLKVQKLPHFEGDLPEYKSALAAGFDIWASLKDPIRLRPLERALIPTGLCFETPEGFELQARPRSGLALKKGLTLLNTPGTIDADYRGEVKILVINLSEKDIVIQSRDRVAQLILAPVLRAKLKEAESLKESARGAGGFGSTGERQPKA